MSNIIKIKSQDFALDVVNCCKYLIEERKEYILSKQLLRSGTSIGANIRESLNSYSQKEFAYKMSIALKESNETDYWLTLLHQGNYITTEESQKLITQNNEIYKILYSIVKTSKQNQRK